MHKGIKSWADDEKPREKLLMKGAASLSDAELLAILIVSGTASRSALDLARDVLELADRNLYQLGRLSLDDFQKVKGVGIARAITISAALELGRRRQMNGGLQRTSIRSSQDAMDIVQPMLSDLNHEVFCVLYVNQSNKLLKHEMVSSGGLTGTVADVRIILKNALLLQASGVILAHNHPSGNPKPSQADLDLTERIREAASLMDIRLLDHIIVAQTFCYSMRDDGIL